MRTKNFFATLLLILTGLQTVCGQKIRLYTTDNKTFEYSIAQLDSIVFVDEQQVIEDIVVTIDANGNADGGHRFTKIDDNNFYIDDIKYTAVNGNLEVTGYNKAFFKGDATIISALIYEGRGTMKVAAIAEKAFRNLTILKSIIISKGLTSIGRYAFENCTGLTSITIPNSVTSIGEYAFRGCSGLTSITIPNSLTSIGFAAFRGCTSLTSITIPNSVTRIGDYAFDGCTSLTKVIVPSIAAWCAILFGSDSANPLYYAHHLYSNESTEITNLVIPDGVSSIGDGAFRGCSGLTSVTIGSGVTSIGSSAFEDCSSLTSVTIPNSVTSIGNLAFYGCTGLTSITIPNSVTSIRNLAFYGCSGLTSITIGSGVSSIGDGAFRGCSGLTSITIGNRVVSIGEYAFSGCSSLTSIKVETGNGKYDSRDNCNAIIETATNTLVVGCKNTTIPNSVKSIGDSAFSYCTSLTSITIPNSVTSIGRYTFYNCSGLTSITIGSGVTSIGNYAFEDCSSLKDVYCYATNPPSASYSSFTYTPISSATLHVPAGSVNAYKNESPWSDFGSIVAI